MTGCGGIGCGGCGPTITRDMELGTTETVKAVIGTVAMVIGIFSGVIFVDVAVNGTAPVSPSEARGSESLVRSKMTGV